MPALCRDCLSTFETRPPRCPRCAGRRLVDDPELLDLGIAHLDCDAFYASVEKRDDPALAARPVIVGGGARGVVATCCYVARIAGVRSAMPMFRALKLCPDAVVIRPRMAHYAAVSRQIRARMEALTPAVEPLSLDEAFLDLRGTARLHGAPPAVLLARLAREIEQDLGVTVSVGLSHNKFLAKIASDLDKPRGFSVIGQAATRDFLRDQPVSLIWGVGEATRRALAGAGLRRLADVRARDRAWMQGRFGASGARIWDLAQGHDSRRVDPRQPIKSVSHETTFETDIGERAALEAHLWHLSEKVSDRLKARDLAGNVVTLKLRRADFSLLTRQHRLAEPSQLGDTMFRTARDLLAALPETGPFRLIGVGMSDLGPATGDPAGDLLDPQAGMRARAERARDAIRARFGAQAITTGRGWRPERD
ncbi:DNA polymerase IV [Phaeovulum vinaykumarii]|uniref:DNA polymerase IV n=1 Tax=Phaeovulum vinaykumarii TaxID=407234 RepID=A0A1N7MLK1_9RHOB|nr:DNA polymerase IV [Phaeovulum vinaykumarii]SIS87045.1 DNA polymerase-4 [Phaeovulum vinaykumarii]SOC13320.1 DNA polymerase-4 [Phaeovulum vinaykumarii]